MTDVAALADRLSGTLAALGDPERAGQEARYLKSDLEFFGVPLPEMRKEVKRLRRSTPALDGDSLVALARHLWAAPVFERRMSAVLLLADGVGTLDVSHLLTVEEFARDVQTWALLDPLATDVSGPIVAAAPDLAREHVGARLDAWATDDSFWIRRLALLSPLRELKAGGGDWERFARHADAMLEEKEFFIRKAIGWELREIAKKRPELVHAWLLPRAARAAGLTVREAVKYLDPEQRAEILAAR